MAERDKKTPTLFSSNFQRSEPITSLVLSEGYTSGGTAIRGWWTVNEIRTTAGSYGDQSRSSEGRKLRDREGARTALGAESQATSRLTPGTAASRRTRPCKPGVAQQRRGVASDLRPQATAQRAQALPRRRATPCCGCTKKLKVYVERDDDGGVAWE
jgi:hypothetical protein